jgi:methionine-rich copper-binding protein CopC
VGEYPLGRGRGGSAFAQLVSSNHHHSKQISTTAHDSIPTSLPSGAGTLDQFPENIAVTFSANNKSKFSISCLISWEVVDFTKQALLLFWR